MCNAGGVALTHVIRFAHPFPAMCLLLSPNCSSASITRSRSNYKKLGVDRG
jgi:hypothetical protein